MRDPGTYVVVVNPMSFANLPEYSESVSNIGDGRGHSGGDIRSHASMSIGEATDGPNVVILKTFEDPFRSTHIQVPTGVPYWSITVPTSPVSSHSLLKPTKKSSGPEITRSRGIAASLLDTGGKDANLLDHYRSLISPQIMRIEGLVRDEDFFELEARTYPPVVCHGSLYSKIC